jgi:hypothetical protein
MNPHGQDPTGERIASGLLAGFFTAFAWFALWQKGITLKGKSGATSFVDGNAGLVVAAFALLFGCVGVALLLRSFRAARTTYFISFALLLVPALALALTCR